MPRPMIESDSSSDETASDSGKSIHAVQSCHHNVIINIHIT